MSWSRGRWVAAWSAALLWASPSWSQPAGLSVSTEYSVAEGCPPFDIYRQQVNELTPRVEFVAPRDAAQRLAITVRRRGEEYFGELGLRAPGQPPARRAVRGETCGEVVEALALATALALDPEALGEVPLPGEVPAEDIELPEVETEPEETESEEVEAVPDPAPSSEGWALRMRAGAEGLRLSGVSAPESSWAGGGSIGVEMLRVAGRTRPSLHLEVLALRGLTPPEARVGLTWAPVLRGALCPVGWQPQAEVRLSPCLSLQGGMLHARGRAGLDALPAARRPWWAGGAEVRLAWSARQSTSWGAELRLGVLLPLLAQDLRAVEAGEDRVLMQVRRVPGVFAGLGLLGPLLDP